MLLTRVAALHLLYTGLWLGLLGVCISLPTTAEARKRPRFVHQTPSTVNAGNAVILRGAIVGIDDLDYAELRYRKVGSGGDYKAIRMKQSGNQFVVKIPGSLVQPPGLEYYIAGINFDQRTKLLGGTPSAPLQFLVVRGEEDPGRRPPPRRRTEDPDPDGWGDIPMKKKKGDKAAAGPNGERLRRRRIVTASSRRRQHFTKTPGITTVITAQDIKQYGWRTLVEILRYTAGLDINDNGYWPDIGMRGLNPTRSKGNRILFLVDGHDMSWRQLQANLVSQAWLSVEDIDRIEIVRGTGSGLWGAGAYQGVIHIVTKTGNSLRGAAATFGISPASGTQFLTLRAGNRFRSGLSFYSSFSMYNDIRSPVASPLFELLFNPKDKPSDLYYVSPNDRNQTRSFLTRLSWRGLTLSIQQSRQDAYAPLNPYSILGGDDTRFITDRLILRLQWRGQLNKNTSMRVWFSFDRMNFAPGTQVEFNPLRSQASRDTESGRFRTYQLQRRVLDPNTKKETITAAGVYQECSSLAAQAGPCIVRQTVQYNDKDNKPKSEAACLLYTKAADSTKPQSKVELTDKYKTWFPRADCFPSARGKRHLKQLQAIDNRFQLGANLTIGLNKSANLLLGVDLEYLDSTLWHFTESWQDELASPESDTPAPTFSNFRLGAYAQLQYQISRVFGITANARVDYDQRYGVRFSPQLALVLQPLTQLFAKLNYSWGYRPPSLYEYYRTENRNYGNPLLQSEDAHIVSVQAGWHKKRRYYAAISGFAAFHNNSIITQTRTPTATKPAPLDGLGEFTYKPVAPNSTYQQLINDSESIMAVGVEVEGNLALWRGLSLQGHLSVAWAPTDLDDELPRQPYSAGLQAAVAASYRYQRFRASLGFLFTGSKLVPNKALRVQGKLPAQDLPELSKDQPIPNWGVAQDNRLQTDTSFRLQLTLQLLKLFGHVDIGLRTELGLAGNVQGFPAPHYDAGDPFLYPQKRYDILGWVSTQF